MSTLLEAQPTLEGLAPAPTLDELIAGVWTGLCAHRTVECPVCHGEMAPQYGAHPRPVGGRCSDCGALVR